MRNLSLSPCAALVGLMLIASLVLAQDPASHNPYGLALLSLSGSFASLGLLLYGSRGTPDSQPPVQRLNA
ncbi:hypothetical protein [Pseudomonas sp. RIT-PI-AD]|uniref:hypothetical protein n=1 Tax=Pseudomonas sp. RIT-PI-AD TaxID=3035294 RepID=UPI0021DAAD29|nr:hypothetical protein [Pseudomonas sp. RIT-PI-AD]